jgi:hypothetical protein
MTGLVFSQSPALPLARVIEVTRGVAYGESWSGPG